MREILIKLEDELYEQCKNTKLTEENEGFDFHIIKSVANGKPLPKGHGRLIDADELIKNWYDDYIKFMTREEIESMDGVIKNAPTIISR